MAAAGTTPADARHLGVLSILYYVYAGLSALLTLAGVLYVVAGAIIVLFGGRVAASEPDVPPEAPLALGAGLMVVGCFTVLLLAARSAALFYCARCLSMRRHRLFCMVMAGIICPAVPLGTALGISTLVVLNGPGMRELFTQSVPATIR